MPSLDPINLQQAGGAAAERRSATRKVKAAVGTTSFAVLHAAAKRRQDVPATASVRAAAVTETADAKSKTAPKDERLEAVEGHKYSAIVGGPRNGMFLNQSGNSRDGEAFFVVTRAGREFHIYGEGRDRMVYEVGRDDGDAKTTTPATPPAATTPASPASGGLAAPPV